ncbi:hypothetical protein G7K_3585-t1 [Saitoella complicata NRRL Y-17804]|uniref:DNA replication regulator Sld3 C-terminal domain-containing protein n=2 Tax=Saitoella complicata (strain BCRC 22490 / CBS 7301 / JCM 7358 / NBRC 10748 / NRRL Y-17804) TaxID=698492 RepID=A0A0E9NJ63_SAICN|nr:hypothetical protein G7K_3585-t1 [Saitoella complicata NRRL Y-17804]
MDIDNRHERLTANACGLSAFIIQGPLASPGLNAAITIEPVGVVNRAYLSIDRVSAESPQLFTAQLPALASYDYVLIAAINSATGKRYGVVEKVDEGLYAFQWCRPDLGENDVTDALRKAADEEDVAFVGGGQSVFSIADDEDWWMQCIATHHHHKPKSDISPVGILIQDIPREPSEPVLQRPDISRSVLISHMPITPMAPEDMLKQVETQYLEALYMSKASLAYFAKTTLSRARVFFTRLSEDVMMGPPGAPGVDRFVAFLKEYTLSITQLEAKYRKESLPKLMETLAKSNEEDADVDGPHALSETELAYVARWTASWRAENPAVNVNLAALNKGVDALKTRETQLQIILLLELLALRPKDSDEALERNDSEPPKKRKKTKKAAEADEFEIRLNLLVDRLIMSQMLGGGKDIFSMFDDDDTTTTKEGDKDEVRQFCTQIIMPFYSSRLPEKCARLYEKCGGHETVQQPAPQVTSPEILRPKRPRKPENPRRILDGKPNIPSLSRSSTAPAAAGAMNPLLPEKEREKIGVPSLERLLSVSRGGVQSSKKFQNREVEFAFKDKDGKESKKDDGGRFGAGNSLRSKMAAATAAGNGPQARINKKKPAQTTRIAPEPRRNVQVSETPRVKRTVTAPPVPMTLPSPAVISSPSPTKSNRSQRVHDNFATPVKPRTLDMVAASPVDSRILGTPVQKRLFVDALGVPESPIPQSLALKETPMKERKQDHANADDDPFANLWGGY